MGDTDNHQSKVILSVELASSLGAVVHNHDSLHKMVSQVCQQSLAEVMATLGIPGTTEVHMALMKEQLPADLSSQFMRVFVNGQLCGFADELLRRVYGYVSGNLPSMELTSDAILTWLGSLINDGTESMDRNHAMLAEFLSLACVAIVKSQPAVLLGVDQVVDYITAIEPIDAWSPEPAWLQPILSRVLALKISLADTQLVSSTLRSRRERLQADIAEDIVAALCPDCIEIQIPKDYFKQITIADQDDNLYRFSVARRDVLQTLGLRLPNFRFVHVEHLKPGCFTFTINHLAMPPWLGLRSGQNIILATAEELASHAVKFTPVNYPLLDSDVYVVDLTRQNLPADVNQTKFNQMFYLGICLDEVLKQNSPCFLHRRLIEAQLELLKSTHPALVQAIRANVSLTQVIQILRTLVAEGISIRNLKLILESLLEYNYMATFPSQEAASHSQIANNQLEPYSNAVAFVRTQLKS